MLSLPWAWLDPMPLAWTVDLFSSPVDSVVDAMGNLDAPDFGIKQGSVKELRKYKTRHSLVATIIGLFACGITKEGTVWVMIVGV